MYRGSSRAHLLVSLLLPHRLTRRFSRGTVSRRVVQIYDVSIGKGSGANGSDGQVALRWQNDGGGYFGIVDREGTVRLEDNPIYMVKSTVDPDKNVVKLRSPLWESRYITGHSDSTVNGRVDPLDPTACNWRIRPAPSDFSSDPSHIVLQFYSNSRKTDNIRDGVFLVINNGYMIEQYSYLRQHGLFSFDHNLR